MGGIRKHPHETRRVEHVRMTLARTVAPETLDSLAADDPAAMRSRGDLRRIHRVMGTRRILLGALRAMASLRGKSAPLRVLELGTGDGKLLLGVARALAPAWPAVELCLLDRQALVDRSTLELYAALGWSARTEVVDVGPWAAACSDSLLSQVAGSRWDLIVTNLFLHHFEGNRLVALLETIQARCDRFLACEPRRAWLPLAASHLIGVIGANAVTREDAVLSVHAGFSGHEISALWPTRGEAWQLDECRAGLFSHCFRAERRRMH